MLRTSLANLRKRQRALSTSSFFWSSPLGEGSRCGSSPIPQYRRLAITGSKWPSLSGTCRLPGGLAASCPAFISRNWSSSQVSPAFLVRRSYRIRDKVSSWNPGKGSSPLWWRCGFLAIAPLFPEPAAPPGVERAGTFLFFGGRRLRFRWRSFWSSASSLESLLSFGGDFFGFTGLGPTLPTPSSPRDVGWGYVRFGTHTAALSGSHCFSRGWQSLAMSSAWATEIRHCCRVISEHPLPHRFFNHRKRLLR